MLKIRNGRLSPKARERLAGYQRDVDGQDTYPARVARAKSRFDSLNSPRNATFAAVRRKLAEMCDGERRCMYCEDSAADEIEHFKPKNLYPEAAFVWPNYLYACGPCNGPKNNRFMVADARTGDLLDVTRRKNDPVVPPRQGDPVLINPRRENPLDFLMLDIRDTFEFTPVADGGLPLERARYTIRVLRLNERDYLKEARRIQMISYTALLTTYADLRGQGATRRDLAGVKRGIQHSPHPTVWAEMKRQRTRHPDLANLFDAAPEALGF